MVGDIVSSPKQCKIPSVGGEKELFLETIAKRDNSNTSNINKIRTFIPTPTGLLGINPFRVTGYAHYCKRLKYKDLR